MIDSSIDNGIGVITLNRPDKRNAMRLSMWQELGEIAGRYAGDESVRAVVVTGAGDHFCAGADISEFGEVRGTPDRAENYNTVVRAAEHALADLPKPVIAAVRGYCVGGGLEIATACDFRFVGDTAKLGITAAKLGIVYGVSSTRRLAGVVGPMWAKYILYSADLLPAERADRIGLVTELRPDGDVVGSAFAFARHLAGRAPLTIAAAKAAIDDYGQIDSLPEPDHSALVQAAAASEYYQSRVAAFNAASS